MTQCRSLSPLLCIAAAIALPLPVLPQATPIGTELQVNTYTTGPQLLPSLAAAANGDFVVVWLSVQDGDANGVFARLFSSAALPLATEFQVNTYTKNTQRFASVAAEADGDFVVVWQSGVQDGDSYGVFARRFSSAGSGLGTEFQVSTYTTGAQSLPALAADADGDFVIAWSSNGQDGSLNGIFARRFSSAGVPHAAEFQVSSYTTDQQRYPSVAASASGDFVIAWQSNDQDGSDYGVFARRFSSDGVALATEFQVNTYSTDKQYRATVAAAASGDFVIAWQSYDQDGSDHGVFARRFSSDGVALATEFRVNTYTSSSQRSPNVAIEADGDFVVVWDSNGQDGSYRGVFGRPFSNDGVALATEFQVSTYTTLYQRIPKVSAVTGRFVVAWFSYTQDGSDYGVFAQRFLSITLDVDGNGAAEPLTDGLLVLRYLFGFTGPTLTSGAVDLIGCIRCDDPAIETYLGGLGLTLDIDRSLGAEPLTDGLLILRYLFGFTGLTLTSGAVDLIDCTRCDAAAIEPYLARLI